MRRRNRPMKNIVIFTDLDGTLLDAEDYAFDPARAALSLIAARRIPLVFTSSKTRAEIELLRSRLGNTHPFITENGGGIFVPPGYFSMPASTQRIGGYEAIVLGKPYACIREEFAALRARHPAEVRGFGDMSVEEVAALTGLDADDAALAMQRDFDEPFVFERAPDEDFLRTITATGLNWTQGRIFHIMGDHDKGRAITLLLALYRREFGEVFSIGLGDGYNDLPMLQAVDYPVLVMHKDGGYDARVNLPHLPRTPLPGPAGWNASVLALLSDGGARAHPSREQAILEAAFSAALAAADPFQAVMTSVALKDNHLRIAADSLDLSAFDRILVVGAGKATARMAQAIETLLGARITAGQIIVKDGHTAPLAVIRQTEASHPIPNEAGVEGTRRILSLLAAADERTLVICLLSGGASALLVAPAEDVSLRDKQDATRLLLNAGASIGELNAVRKHLSAVKGGQLARAAYPAHMVTLILSDVIGDPPGVIASGPTAPDDSTFADAAAVLTKYGLTAQMPPSVMRRLERGAAGLEAETVKRGASCLEVTHNVIIGGLRRAISAAGESFRRCGFAPHLISDILQGEAREAAHLLAQAARAEQAKMQPGEQRCLLWGGETTVTVRGTGKGGRNQELALAFALEIEGLAGITLLSAGTDGTDGPTDAAGAVVDGATVTQARNAGMDPLQYLDNNDSYEFFRLLDAAAGTHTHLKTGPTGTNVMDIQIVLLTK
jgi:glycerate 2-kinase